MICIFCLKEKPPRKGSGEHPIPLSVGGSWTIDRVCDECANKFGYTHDADLSKVTAIAERREALNLAGNSGKVPNTLKDALSHPVTVADSPYHRMMVRQGGDGSLNASTIPNIEFDITVEDSGQCQVAIRPETFVIGMIPEEEALLLIKRRLKAALEERGISFESDLIAAAATKLVSHIEVFKRPITVRVTRKIITGGYAASLLKAAYEAAWYWLGDSWLSDPEAETIRQHLFGNESAPIRGAIRDRDLRALNINSHDRPRTHVIYLFRREGALAVEIQLFDLYSLGVIVTRAPEKYRLPSTSAIIMDATKGTYTEVTSRGLFSAASEN